MSLAAPWAEHNLLRFGRVLSVLLLVTGALIAPLIEQRFSNIYNAIQSVFSLIQGPSLAILLLGLLWRRANRHGAMAGLITGVLFCISLNTEAMQGIFPSEEPFLFIAWWSFVLTLVVTAAVSLVTPPEPEEKIRGLTWGSVARDPEVQAALSSRALSSRTLSSGGQSSGPQSSTPEERGDQ